MSSNKRPRQCDRILEYLHEFGTITQLEAFRDIGVMRLASRVSEMRKNGVNIIDKQVSVKNRYGDTCYIKQYMLG